MKKKDKNKLIKDLEQAKLMLFKLQEEENLKRSKIPVFEKLSLTEKQNLGKLLFVVQDVRTYNRAVHGKIVPLIAYSRMKELLKNRTFGRLKPFYQFLVEHELAGLVVDLCTNREDIIYFNYSNGKPTKIDYEP